MCVRCTAPGGGYLRLSRRTFHTFLLSATVAPGCLLLPPEDLVEPQMRLAVPAGAPRTVALTLDACSGAADMRIIDTLIQLAVPATIFVTGLWLHGNAGTVALLRSRPDLFSVQNHGERHLPPVLGTRTVYGLPVAGTMDAIRREVEGGAAAIMAAGFDKPVWYRGAAALYSPAALQPIEAMGYRIAGYSLPGDEGASLPAETVAHRIANAAIGDVIIAHVNQPRRPSGAGVAAGIAALHATGTVFVGLDREPMTALPCRLHRMRPAPIV